MGPSKIICMVYYIDCMENQQIILLAAGCVLLYFLWLHCYDEGFTDDFESFRGAAMRDLKRGAKSVGRAGKKAGKAVGKGIKKVVGGGKKHRKRGDMTGLTFVCKAVDFGPMAGGGMVPGGMTGAPGAPAAKGVRVAGRASGKSRDRRGPRNTPTRDNVADLNTKKGRRNSRR